MAVIDLLIRWARNENMHRTYKEWQRHKCEKSGHDWAFQDCETFMTKVCLRCGATQIFFPEESDEILDDDDTSEE